MQATPYVVATYAIIWLGLLAYVGWIALRMRGAQTEMETIRELVDERLGENDGAHEPSGTRTVPGRMVE